MKTYTVYFTGHVEVEAESLEDAYHLVDTDKIQLEVDNQTTEDLNPE